MKSQVATFLKHLDSTEHYSRNTITSYQNDLSQFADFFREGLTWAELDELLIYEYISYLRAKGYASSSVARKVAAIKSFSNYLLDKGILTYNVGRRITTPKVSRPAQPILTPKEVERLLATTEGSSPKNLRNHVLLSLLYYTNLHLISLVEFTVSDFDGTTLAGELLSPEGAARLQEYLSEGRPALVKEDSESALFLNHRGSRLSRQGMWLIIKHCAKQAQLEVAVTPATLRRSAEAHKQPDYASNEA